MSRPQGPWAILPHGAIEADEIFAALIQWPTRLYRSGLRLPPFCGFGPPNTFPHIIIIDFSEETTIANFVKSLRYAWAFGGPRLERSDGEERHMEIISWIEYYRGSSKDWFPNGFPRNQSGDDPASPWRRHVLWLYTAAFIELDKAIASSYPDRYLAHYHDGHHAQVVLHHESCNRSVTYSEDVILVPAFVDEYTSARIKLSYDKSDGSGQTHLIEMDFHGIINPDKALFIRRGTIITFETHGFPPPSLDKDLKDISAVFVMGQTCHEDHGGPWRPPNPVLPTLDEALRSNFVRLMEDDDMNAALDAIRKSNPSVGPPLTRPDPPPREAPPVAWQLR